MANEAAAHREFDEKIARKYGRTKHRECEDSWYSCPLSDEGCANPNEKECTCGLEAEKEDMQSAIDEAVRTALEKAAQEMVMEGEHRYAEQIRSIVLRAEDVREG